MFKVCPRSVSVCAYDYSFSFCFLVIQDQASSKPIKNTSSASIPKVPNKKEFASPMYILFKYLST